MSNGRLYPWWRIFLYISKICGGAVRTLPMVPEESHHGCGWRTLGYNEVRARIYQALMIADTICKEGVRSHLKENKFWWKGDLSLVLPLPHFSFKDHLELHTPQALVGVIRAVQLSNSELHQHTIFILHAVPLFFFSLSNFICPVSHFISVLSTAVSYETITWSSLLIGF